MTLNYSSREALESLYGNNHVAKAAVDIPVEDLLARWRVFDSSDPSSAAIMEIENRWQVRSHLAQAMKTARLYGSAMVVIWGEERSMSNPIEIDTINQDGIEGLCVFNRFDCPPELDICVDLFSPHYGQPLEYKFPSPTTTGELVDVHHSRVIRFDGIEPPGGFSREKWSVSVLPCVVNEVNTIRNLEMIVNRVGKVQAAKALNDLLDRYWIRLGAAMNVPPSRFKVQSVLDMNTSDDDFEAYSAYISATQVKELTEPLRRLDAVMASSAGIEKVPDFSFPELFSESDANRQKVAKTQYEAVQTALSSGIISLPEAEAILDNNPFRSELHT